MSESQTTLDVIRVAVQREREAHSFFTALSDCVQSPGIKSLLKDLAKEEIEHREKLELELMKMGCVVSPGERSSEENPYSVEAEEWADMDYADVLRLGIEKEDISFRLYVDLASSLEGEDTKNVLLTLAEEELRHKLRFRAEFEKLPGRK